ncbi:MAG TPA: fumarylacetoacetate hydrolase family protein, partial [Solirubrobacterales bacterium]
MRIVSYRRDEEGWRCGIEVDGSVLDAEEGARRTGLDEAEAARLASSRAFVALDRETRTGIALAAGEAGDRIAIEELELGPPIWDPEKIVCLGLNYRDHAEEAGLEPPKMPMFFAKFANSLVGPRAQIVVPEAAKQIDYEAELAVVIGRGGRDILAAEALGHVAGAMAFN